MNPRFSRRRWLIYRSLIERSLIDRCLITGAVSLSLLLLSGCKRSTQSYLDRGQSYMQKGNYESARIEFLNAVSQDPRSAQAHQRLAEAYLAEHNGSEGLQNLQAATDLDPQN